MFSVSKGAATADTSTESGGGEAVDAMTLFADKDGDGFGDPNSFIASCELTFGYVEDNTDCDDTSSTVNPAATEVCDNEDIDEDCDGDPQSGAFDQSFWYIDLDGDGFGNSDLEIGISELNRIGIGSCVDDEALLEQGSECFFIVGSTATGTFVEGPFSCTLHSPYIP